MANADKKESISHITYASGSKAFHEPALNLFPALAAFPFKS